MARKLRNGLLILLAAVIMTFAAWMLWPRSLTDALGLEGREISVSIVTTGWETSGTRGTSTTGPPWTWSGTPSRRAVNGPVREKLDGYTWHPCWDTLTGETALSGIGELSVTLYDSQDAERTFLSTAAGSSG